MLRENTLYGEIDRVQTAIDRVVSFGEAAEAQHPRGYALMDSGGKDSDVIKTIAYMAHQQHGVKFEIIHSHTTADHPATVRYVRREQERWRALGIPYTIVYPTYKGERTYMWKLIERKGCPTRVHRWCCEYLKERTAGEGRFTITGVRWAESARRKNTRGIYELPNGSKYRINLNNDNDAHRGMVDRCVARGQFCLNPIIDWQDAHVWEFHETYELPHNPLYDWGAKRVGCVGCPMGDNKTELEKLPKYKNMYIRSFQRFLNRRTDLVGKNGWHDGESMYRWWVNGVSVPSPDRGQLSFFDEEEEESID